MSDQEPNWPRLGDYLRKHVVWSDRDIECDPAHQRERASDPHLLAHLPLHSTMPATHVTALRRGICPDGWRTLTIETDTGASWAFTPPPGETFGSALAGNLGHELRFERIPVADITAVHWGNVALWERVGVTA